MKKFLLSTLCLLAFSSFSYAGESDSDLTRPMNYNIEVRDANHKIIYSTSLNNLNSQPQEKNVDNFYIDNCIMNNGIVENTKSSIKTGVRVSFLKESDIAQSVMVDVSNIVATHKINTGECDIEELVVAKNTITQNLPFVEFEYTFHLKDDSGKELPTPYYLKINSQLIKN